MNTPPLVTFEQILEYETSRLSLIQSIWYGWFLKSFVKKVKRRYAYYTKFMAAKYMEKLRQLSENQ